MADWFALRGFVHTGRWASQGETLLSSSLTYRFPFFNLGHVDLKIFTTQKLRVVFYSVENFRISSPEDSNSSDPEKTAPRRQEGKSGYIQVCNKGSRQPEDQRSGSKLRNSAFCVWEDVSLWAH